MEKIMVNIGAVMTPFPRGVDDPSFFSGTKLPLLQRMNPNTVRIPQYWGGTRSFADSQLQQIVDAVTTEVIIQSSEYPDASQALSQLQAILPIVQANPNKYFVFEIGNEPDQGPFSNDPVGAGQRFLQAYRNCKNTVGDHTDGRVSNLWYAINQPSNNAAADYWNAFNAQGVGEAEYQTVHIYPPTSALTVLCDHPEWADQNPWKIYDWVRGYYGTAKGVKVTEAGMPVKRQGTDPFSGSYGSMRGFDYIAFANRIAQTGNTDSVCFYGLPYTETFPDGTRPYDLDQNDLNQLATRWDSGYCP